MRELGSLLAFRAILPAQKWFVIDVVRREHNQARLSEIADKLQLLADNVRMPSLLAHVEDSGRHSAGMAGKSLTIPRPD